MSYTKNLMSETLRTSLFFIASPQYKLTAVENFLKKRDYDVHVETDIKAGLLRLIEVQPDFVFVAIDHPHPNINVLPQIIEQCLTTSIIPFTHSSTKADIKKLDESTYINKILPPLSGPAVERMAIKLRNQQPRTAEKKAQHAKNLDSVVNSFLEQLSEKQKYQKAETKPISKEHAEKLKSKNGFYSSCSKNLISSKQKENLQKTYQQSIKSDLTDILETSQHAGSSNVVPLNKDKRSLYSLLVQSKEWSGLLMAHSSAHLEKHLLEPVLKNWVAQEFKHFNENESHIFFEVSVNMHDFQAWVENKTEYTETLQVNGTDLALNFVGIEPKQLFMDFDEAHDLLDVHLNWVPLREELHLNLFLHLPENKKYLLYTPKGQQLSDLQKSRLTENRVEKLHSPVEFEEEVKKLKMVHYFEHLLSEAQGQRE